jgi:hypothetical protein
MQGLALAPLLGMTVAVNPIAVPMAGGGIPFSYLVVPS